MKPYVLAFFIAGSLVAQQTVKWETSFPAAQARARAEHKLIFMDVWTEWCGWCIKLQKDTFPSPEAQAALAKVVPLSLKTEYKDGKPTSDKSYESLYGVQGFPALFLLDAEGKVVNQHSGYLPSREFAGWVNGATSNRK